MVAIGRKRYRIDVALDDVECAGDAKVACITQLDLRIPAYCYDLSLAGISKSIDRVSRSYFWNDFWESQFLGNGWRGGRFGSRIDPGLNHGDFFRGEFLAFAWRHDFWFSVFLEAAFDHLDEQAFVT